MLWVHKYSSKVLLRKKWGQMERRRLRTVRLNGKNGRKNGGSKKKTGFVN